MSDAPSRRPEPEGPAPRPAEPPAREGAADTKPGWIANEEYGTVLGIRFIVALCNLAGRGVARLFLRGLMLYYTLFAARARRASRDWLRVALGREPSWRDVYRHLTTFGLVALDRVFLLQGRKHLFDVRSHGTEHLRALADARQGALLVGAHLGSFEAMRAQGDTRGYDLHILSYMENARKLTSVFAALAPEMQSKVIALGTTDALLHARDVLEQGALLAILGDRTGLNAKVTEVDFFDRPAPFPTGIFLMAATLRCPVYLVFGVYRGGNRYDISCEPFADRIVLPRGSRERALHTYAQRYASRLEQVARQHPYNWFNIYDFWSGPETQTGEPPPPPAPT